MRFDPGETIEEKATRMKQWHRIFAWRPRRIGPHDWRWLETVMRRSTLYRFPRWFERPFNWVIWEYASVKDFVKGKLTDET